MGFTGHVQGRNVSFRMWDTAGASFSLTAHGNDFSLTHSAQLEEATTYGDINVNTLAVGADYTVTYAGYFAGSGIDSAASKLAAIVSASVGSEFHCMPGGSGTSDILGYAGCINIESLETGHPAVGIGTFSMTLRPRSGSLTYTLDGWS